ncbi:unnamed protein product [Rotaria sordida]|uniref:ER membrane protein complex subunit 7 beta-sandwich domain-containing protein n=1 Tax=Rotaria sordida TaxID=392033 RepID=A0A814K893_9BILA|nr:unnamed protein product [Rotaria sordida]CAF1047896.1 unnamed protein product [Rotaria sordida]CAF1049109.1 unnamed protein product [Rotaria sordida]
MLNTIVWCRFYSILIMFITYREIIAALSTSPSENIGSHKIEGQILFQPNDKALDDMRILVNEGEYIGIPRVDGTFVISGIPSGSYVVSISSPRHVFEPVRVDINTNGKIRARKVNFVQPNEVVVVKYPLRFNAYVKPNYFKTREVYRWTDIIFNPTFAPIILLTVLFLFVPKFLPQETEMRQMFPGTNDIMQPNMNIPDIAALFAQWFGGPRRIRQTSQQSISDDKTDSDDIRRQKKNKKALKGKN